MVAKMHQPLGFVKCFAKKLGRYLKKYFTVSPFKTILPHI